MRKGTRIAPPSIAQINQAESLLASSRKMSNECVADKRARHPAARHEGGSSRTCLAAPRVTAGSRGLMQMVKTLRLIGRG
ncbi:hypothetical protein KFL_000140680 [Klebsormidium nitens]|uniref:Uncharacterized protein n=1 Tax=Klebsormidium nitens TaxID=105231 RepID=A0A1Y1HPN9_KLENI|nr:hypothetical protein KFL_000140680 [Klebsormidium nitens]|eukprot:GAQ78547.1 hypothetical protein KFL_000140680 [Klebsormidium nitens]